MPIRNKKLAVLNQLSQEIEPIGLVELLKKLGTGYAERSVRRWLVEMRAEGLIEAIGQKRGTRYKATSPVTQSIALRQTCFGPESAPIIQQVQRPLYERKPAAYNDHWLESCIDR